MTIADKVQQHLFLEVEPDGLATLWIDTPGKMNLLSMQFFTELNDRLDEMATRKDVKALVIASRKKDFAAGVDIKMFAEFTTAEAGTAAARTGQAVLQKIADLKFPTVAAIQGNCLGGGLELSLCCTTRLASDSPDTVLALPEVMIGLLPGMGGTQRLPRLVGLRAALDMILTGKKMRAAQCKRIGLVDEVVPAPILVTRAQAVARQLAAGSVPRRPGKDLQGLLLEATVPGRAVIYSKAEEQVLKTTKGHYPAPLKALEAVRRGYRKSLERGLGD